jgi:hypothetical protein
MADSEIYKLSNKCLRKLILYIIYLIASSRRRLFTNGTATRGQTWVRSPMLPLRRGALSRPRRSVCALAVEPEGRGSSVRSSCCARIASARAAPPSEGACSHCGHASSVRGSHWQPMHAGQIQKGSGSWSGGRPVTASHVGRAYSHAALRQLVRAAPRCSQRCRPACPT